VHDTNCTAYCEQETWINSRTLFPSSQAAVRFTAALSRKLIGHDTYYKQLGIHPLKTSWQ